MWVTAHRPLRKLCWLGFRIFCSSRKETFAYFLERLFTLKMHARAPPPFPDPFPTLTNDGTSVWLVCHRASPLRFLYCHLIGLPLLAFGALDRRRRISLAGDITRAKTGRTPNAVTLRFWYCWH